MAFYLSGTMSKVDGSTRLQVLTGKQGVDKILVSDASGRADWVGARSMYTGQRFVGELYGGGIVVGVWNEGGAEKVLIASLTDATSTYLDQFDLTTKTVTEMYWIGDYEFNDLKNTSTGATSSYDGRANTGRARSYYPFWLSPNNQPEPFALNFNGYAAQPEDTGINGYTDWYVPALHEMRMVYDAAVIINRVLGENNFKFDATSPNATRYWTSTESSASSVWALDISAQFGFSTMSKGSGGKLRPVRLESTNAPSGLVTQLDATNRKSYSDTALPGRWSDLANSGLTSSYSFGFSSVNSTGPTYSPLQGGYLTFNGSSYIEFVAPIEDTNIVTVEMWLRLGLLNGQPRVNYALFGWNIYCVYIDGYGNIGFNTGNGGDTFGLSVTLANSLNLFGNWNHYVFEMRSGTYANNKIYVNGVSQTLTQNGTQNPANAVFSGGVGRIGGQRSTTSYLAWYDISVFNVYKRALTQSEVVIGYEKYKRNYEIGISTTHTLDVRPGPGTFSITQNLTFDVLGKKNLRVLRSDSMGFSSWAERDYVFDRPDNERFIGDMYGGGIIASKWRYPANVFNYLIMSKKDQNRLTNATVVQGSNLPTAINLPYDITSSVSVGDTVTFAIGGVSRTISVVSDTSFYEQASGTLNTFIPDNSTITAALALTGAQYTVVPSVIDVKINITQDWLNDLYINLVAPNGNVVNLYGADGLGSNDNMVNTVFTSDTTRPAISTGVAPGYTGRWRWKGQVGVVTGSYTSNVSTLAALLAGGTMNGTWTLVVNDKSSGNQGYLNNFSISTPITRIVTNETRSLASPVYNNVSVYFNSGLSVEWNGLPSTLLGNTTTFNGATNSKLITSPNTLATHSAAALATQNDGDGFTDWYLPSVYEMTEALGNLAAVGYVFGTAGVPENRTTYWTSTEFSSTQSYAVDNAGPKIQSKSTRSVVRPFRQVSVLSSNKTWNGDPWADAPADWSTLPYDEKNWQAYTGIKTSNLLFHVNTSNLNSYKGMSIGLTPSISSLVNGYTGTVLSNVGWSFGDSALILNDTQSTSNPVDSVIDFGTTFLIPNPPRTFEFWFKGTSTANAGMLKGILSTDVVIGSLNLYGVIISTTYESANDSYSFNIYFGNGGSSYTSTLNFSSNQILKRNVWGHIVFVVSSLSEVSLYVNKVLYPLNQNGTLANIVSSGGTGKFLIGTFNSYKWIPGSRISTLRIYMSALTKDEVANNFERDRIRHGV